MSGRIIKNAAMPVALLALLAPAGAAPKKPASTAKDLKIISVDVEGGAAVLFRTPDGKSLLIDAGFPPGSGDPRRAANATTPARTYPSSADKIAAAAKELGITKIDYFLLTHYHGDHVGGVPALLEKLPVDTFIDHGVNREMPAPNTPPERLARSTQAGFENYMKLVGSHPHIVPIVGKTLDIGALHIEFVTADGNVPAQPLPGAGQPNPDCAGVATHPNDGGDENNRSLGMVMTFGKTKIFYFGDLTWNKEIELLCPVNKVGKADVYFVTGHGMNLSSSPPTRALDPLVAVMQNGPTKGGDQEVITMVKSYPNLQDLWLTHYSIRYPNLNPDLNLIANPNWIPDQYYHLGLDITPAGQITVTNSRNNYSKTYKARGAQ
jgi:beta-lactamase superfamily II metal-dependent hydrolase